MRHSSYLEVNLDLLGRNYQKIMGLAPKSQVLPMVKADAYGNGLIPISRFLANDCKVRKLGCASLGEALRLLDECPDFESELLIFSDNELKNEKLRKAYLEYNIAPVINHASDLELFLSLSEFKDVPLILKVETGMSRLGLELNDLARIAPRFKNRPVQHLMTHLGTSYMHLKTGDKTHRQFEEFQKAKKILSDAGVEVRETSVANSGAIEQGFAINETYVRPGLMLYGPPSVEPRKWEGQQISRLVTKVLKTFMVKKGTPVGYGIFVAPEDIYMMVVPIGYGDGILTYATGTELNIKGHKGKIFGRVNMDMTFIAFDPTVAGQFKDDEPIEIWGHDNRIIADIAAQMKTHPYQLMTAISGRIPRIYKVK